MSITHRSGGPGSRPRGRGRGRGRSGGFIRAGIDAYGRSRAKGGGRHRRGGGGITKTQLRGFHKVVNLLRKVGMHPRKLGGHVRRTKK